MCGLEVPRKPYLSTILLELMLHQIYVMPDVLIFNSYSFDLMSLSKPHSKSNLLKKFPG